MVKIEKIIQNTINMNILTLFECDDIRKEISLYLNFEDIVNLSNGINKNCFKKYNFISDDFKFKEINDIFTWNETDDEENYLNDIFYNFEKEIKTYFYEYMGEETDDEYGFEFDCSMFCDILDGMQSNYFHNIVMKNFDFEREDIEYEDIEDGYYTNPVNNDKTFDELFDEYYEKEYQRQLQKYKHENSRKIRSIKEFMHNRINELFYSTYQHIYARKVAEFIETKNLSFKTYNYSMKKIDKYLKKKGYDVHTDTIHEYIYAFVVYECIEDFCRKCGSFEHANESNECIFIKK